MLYVHHTLSNNYPKKQQFSPETDKFWAKKMEDSNECRMSIDLLRSRLNLLSGKDKLLMTMYLENGNSYRQIARLAGINEKIIARRIRKLSKNLIEGQYITCLQNRSQFTENELTIAKDYFLTGLSIRKIMTKRNMNFYSVRETIKKIQQILLTIEGKN